MKYDISQLSDLFQHGIKELKKDYEFEIGKDGVTIIAEKGNCLGVCRKKDSLILTYDKGCEFYRAFCIALNYQSEITLTQRRKFGDIGIMIDNSRNAVLRIDSAKKLVRLLAVSGYNILQLYTEDTYEIYEEPYFGYLRGRFSQAEIKEVDSYCTTFGITLMPCIQTLAHLGTVLRWPEYAKCLDIGNVLLVEEERTYKLIENMFRSIAQCFTCRKVNIGMDEAVFLGRGRYLDKHGYKPNFKLMLNHLNKVLEIANRYGFSCSMWSDMFFWNAFGGYYGKGKMLPAEIAKVVPENIELIYWDYDTNEKKIYDEIIENHQRLNRKITFAGCAWKQWSFAPLLDISMQRTQTALDSCAEHGIQSVMLTAWGDCGNECSLFSILPNIVHCAEYSYGQTDIAYAFKNIIGADYKAFMELNLPDAISLERERTTISNFSKIYLYNDCLLGIFDYTVSDYSKVFTDNIKKLGQAKLQAGEYSYIFNTLIALLDAVLAKYNIGVILRDAYKKGNKTCLESIAKNNISDAIQKIEIFYEAFRKQWMTENKPHGFDVHDIRIGGLIGRLKSCRRTVLDYCYGLVDSIPELEEQILSAYKFEQDKHFVEKTWLKMVSVNYMDIMV